MGKGKPKQILGIFGGVFTPVAMSQLSSVIFLRVGLVVGQSGLIVAILITLLSYLTLYLTALSVSAISTNGSITRGGVYYMLSRTFGLGVGGSIGILYSFAQIACSALFMAGAVEAFLMNFGPLGVTHPNLIPIDNYGVRLGLSAALNICCFCVQLLGSDIIAKAANFLFAVVVVIIGVVFASFFREEKIIALTRANALIYANETDINTTLYASFTGISAITFSKNIFPSYSVDYSTGKTLDTASIIAIFISGLTGILSGANVSGELKNPAKAIPTGTMTAMAFTSITYMIMFIMSSLTCDRKLLQQDYIYMQDIAFVPAIIITGIFCTTITAAICSITGAARIIEAVADDKLFRALLKPVTWFKGWNNAVIALIMCHVVVQLVLLLGSLNSIAPAGTVLNLLTYGLVNFACMGLCLANSANFRPVFGYFGWKLSLLGGLLCFSLCFVVQPLYTIGAIVLLTAMAVVLQRRHEADTYEWGSLAQALFYQQMRTYLLLLNEDQHNEKFWQPRIVMLSQDAQRSAPLWLFMDSVKQSGLHVISHVTQLREERQQMPGEDPCHEEKKKWADCMDELNLKSFMDFTECGPTESLASTMLHLIRLAGLGAIKANTVLMGLLGNPREEYCHHQLIERIKGVCGQCDATEKSPKQSHCEEESPKQSDCEEKSPKQSCCQCCESTRRERTEEDNRARLDPDSYVWLLRKIRILQKNILLSRNFHKYMDETVSGAKQERPVLIKEDSHVYTCQATGTVVYLRCVVKKGSIITHNNTHSGPLKSFRRSDSFETPLPPPHMLDFLIEDRKKGYLDVWALDFLEFVTNPACDTTELTVSDTFLLQIACIASRAKLKHALYSIRIFIPVRLPVVQDLTAYIDGLHQKIGGLVSALRINASIDIVPVSSVGDERLTDDGEILEAMRKMNKLIKENCAAQTAVVMLRLPEPSDPDAARYLKRMTTLSHDLPPTLFGHAHKEVNATEA